MSVCSEQPLTGVQLDVERGEIQSDRQVHVDYVWFDEGGCWFAILTPSTADAMYLQRAADETISRSKYPSGSSPTVRSQLRVERADAHRSMRVHIPWFRCSDLSFL